FDCVNYNSLCPFVGVSANASRQKEFRHRQRQLLYNSSHNQHSTNPRFDSAIGDNINNDPTVCDLNENQSDSLDTTSDTDSEDDHYYNISMDDTSDNDDLFTQADGDLHNTKPLYFNSNITVEQAYIYICDYISEFKLTLVQQKRLILLLILLLPNDSLLNQKHLSKWMSVKNSFTYSVLCAHCTNILDTKTGICSILCPMNGKLRTDDGIIETCLADIKGSMSRVAERNIDLIMEYPKQAKFLVPNDIINGTIYQRDATNDPTITIQLHSDGFDILTTKHKHCYATTATILEIPPPLRDYAQNKILLSLYFSKKEPTPECLLNNLIKRLDELRTIGLTVINSNKKINFKIKFQGDKNDQPCRSLKWKISQFNGFDACTNCLQHGETRNSNMVYYPYTTNPTPRTQQMYLNAARMADSRTTVTQHAIVQGIKGTSPLLKIFDNVSEHALFDYMHACCGSSGHMAHVLRRWITSASANVAQSMSDFILNIMMPHDTKVSFKLLSQIDWWKSKDYRFFLLYISMPFAINYVPHQVTSHYVLFFISIRILHYYQYRTDIDYADMFIDNYRKELANIYGHDWDLYTNHLFRYFPSQVKNNGRAMLK
ncbi:unnamed protein product, partial [Didymodactylos carnosus]